MGMDPRSPFRAQAAVEYTLNELAGQGHMFAPLGELVAASIERVDLPEDLLLEGIEALKGFGRVVEDSEAVYLRGFYQAERGVADTINVLIAAPASRRTYPAPGY